MSLYETYDKPIVRWVLRNSIVYAKNVTTEDKEWIEHHREQMRRLCNKDSEKQLIAIEKTWPGVYYAKDIFDYNFFLLEFYSKN